MRTRIPSLQAEDLVLPLASDEARHIDRPIVRPQDPKNPRRSLLYVRVNAADTEFCYGDLVAIVGPGLDGIVLPKVESATTLATIDWLLAQLEHQ